MAKIELDFVHEFTIGEFFKAIEPYQATITKYIAEGPAGGNPCVELTFPTHEQAFAYAKTHFDDRESEDWIRGLIH